MNAYLKPLIAEGLVQALGGSVFPHINSKMRVIASRYRGDGNPLHIVSIGGEYFKADNHDIQSLRNGLTPDELQLCRCGDSFEDDGDA